MAVLGIKEQGWKKGLENWKQLQSQEAQRFYLKGWAEAIGMTNVNDSCMKEALYLLTEDTESIDVLLQKYALQDIFLGKPSLDQKKRLNRTLNIQWALDIAAQFPEEENATQRLSTNLESWLHEVPDEDDREDIESWAKRVAKGKYTEEAFATKIRDLLNE